LAYSKCNQQDDDDSQIGGELGELMNVEKQRNQASVIIKDMLDMDWLHGLSHEKKLYDKIVLQKLVGRGGEGKVYKTNTIDDAV